MEQMDDCILAMYFKTYEVNMDDERAVKCMKYGTVRYRTHSHGYMGWL